MTKLGHKEAKNYNKKKREESHNEAVIPHTAIKTEPRISRHLGHSPTQSFSCHVQAPIKRVILNCRCPLQASIFLFQSPSQLTSPQSDWFSLQPAFCLRGAKSE